VLPRPPRGRPSSITTLTVERYLWPAWANDRVARPFITFGERGAISCSFVWSNRRRPRRRGSAPAYLDITAPRIENARRCPPESVEALLAATVSSRRADRPG